MNSNHVSVIIPVYNGRKYLKAAIESALNQTIPPDEILVIDDASTDGSGDVARAFGSRVICLRQEKKGQAEARNLGVVQSSGSMLAFLDSDDLWPPRRLEQQLSAFVRSSALEAVGGQVRNFISPELGAEASLRLGHASQLSGERHVGALLIRREAFMRIGMFDSRWKFSDGVEWWERAILLGLRVHNLSDLVLQRRLHNSNLTLSQDLCRRELAMILHLHLAKRRAAHSTRTLASSDNP